MRIKSVFSHSFEKYGKVLSGYDVSDLLKKFEEASGEEFANDRMMLG